MKDNYGSKKGYVKAIWYRVLFLLGGFKSWRNIEFSQVKRLVFVCSGNICRSSLAEYQAKKLNVPTESFGLHCRGGDPADHRAVAFGKKYSLDLSKHITRNINQYSPKSGDLIVAMEPKHIEELYKHGFKSVQITSLPIWSLNSPYLHDPYNCNQRFFNKCEEVVIDSVNKLIAKIKDN